MAFLARIVPVTLLVATVMAQGVHRPATLIGRWKVKSISVPAGVPGAERAKAMMRPATIDFSKDKTFAMTLVAPMKGTWSVKGSEVALTITFLMGKKMSEFVAMARTNYENDPSPRHKIALDELSKPLLGVLSSDGKTLTMKPAPGKAGLVFVKAS